MQELKIGQAVVCTGYVQLEYDETNHRKPFDYPTRNFNGVIVGKAIQPLGKYHGPSYGMEWDAESPYLVIRGTVELWQVKIGWRNKPLLVRDENLQPCAAFDLPKQSRRPAPLPAPAVAA